MYLVVEHVLDSGIGEDPEKRRRMTLEETKDATLSVDIDACSICTTPRSFISRKGIKQRG